MLEQDGYTPQPWNAPGILVGGEYTLENLVRIAKDVDGAVLIFGEDVNTSTETHVGKSARRNVILEYGLFAGHVGVKNIGFCRLGQTDIPSDMLGVTYIDLNSEYGWRSRMKAWAKGLAPRANLPQGPTLPAEPDRLRGNWEDRFKESKRVPMPGEPFRLYTFFGLYQDVSPPRTFEDEPTSVGDVVLPMGRSEIWKLDNDQVG